jgi:UDP-N-acetylglucosamine--N-acetylmuramyl-(pentapeptide) pyrophosphoryl-undecaprenol N-acetylglucosamine transferase
METFFPSDRIYLTGNPVRNDIMDLSNKKSDGIGFYGLDHNKKTIFIMGGSLGAKHINQAVVSELEALALNKEIQVLWQCGKGYFESLSALSLPAHIKLLPFIERMDLAYACSDLIVSRAGATSISELTLVGKPVILVPSPNVSEDHQTKNARALSDVGAAVLLPDNQVIQNLWPQIEGILWDDKKQAVLVDSIRKLALPNSTSDIVNICLKVMNHASK